MFYPPQVNAGCVGVGVLVGKRLLHKTLATILISMTKTPIYLRDDKAFEYFSRFFPPPDIVNFRPCSSRCCRSSDVPPPETLIVQGGGEIKIPGNTPLSPLYLFRYVQVAWKRANDAHNRF